jgi:hypothetical protein
LTQVNDRHAAIADRNPIIPAFNSQLAENVDRSMKRVVVKRTGDHVTGIGKGSESQGSCGRLDPAVKHKTM